MRIVVAPDSFKGTLTAAEAARALADGWLSVRPADEVVLRPMADGGEGTVDAFAELPGGQVRTVDVVGPTGAPRVARWVMLPDGTAVIELAECCGLLLLDEPAPGEAHTLGFGLAIRAAIEAGASRLLLAIGGSASTDGGAGLLVGLGARLLDESGAEVAAPGNATLRRIATVDTSEMVAPPAGGAVILSDVDNPLLGERGAAAVFGPQKGGDPVVLEPGLAHFAGVLGGDPTAPGAGAAGGAGFALQWWGALFSAGAEAVGEAVGLPAAAETADLVITGEGALDAQTAAGKVVSYVRRVVGDSRTAVVAGRIDAEVDGFAGAVSLLELAGESALTEPAWAARAAGAHLAERFATP